MSILERIGCFKRKWMGSKKSFQKKVWDWIMALGLYQSPRMGTQINSLTNFGYNYIYFCFSDNGNMYLLCPFESRNIFIFNVTVQ
jgi:hypothetical protein